MKLLTCVCNNCPGQIQFEAAKMGQTLICPHCGMETVLHYAQAKPAAKPYQAVQPKVKAPTRKPMSTEAQCNCQKCGKPIAFDEENSGRIADCPHCGQETTLYIPAPAKALARAVVAAPSTPQRSEALPDNLIVMGYVLAFLFPIAGFFIGLYLITKKESGHGVACMAASIVAGGLWLAILTSE